jgi:ABC-type Na+ transport system ATPase subunit NatA
MLEARNLTKRYAGIPVVNDVSFVIQRGETLGYLGPNGAGKSTTVKMIIGLLEPTSGEIALDGHDIHKDPEASIPISADESISNSLGVSADYPGTVSNRKRISFYNSWASGKTATPPSPVIPKGCARRFS